MSVARNLLAGGPAYVAFNGANIPLGEDSRLEMAPVNTVISGALYGEIDEAYTDLIVKGTGTPLTYDNLAVLWPYLQPTIGQRIFGNSDTPFSWLSNNGDLITVTAGAVTRMPDLVMSVDKPAIGPMEWSGLVGSGLTAPSHANAYYTLATGQSFSGPAVTAAKIPRQKYTAAWGSFTGFTNFQAQEGWTITHELKLAPVKIQGRTVDMMITSYRTMAKCRPTEPTMAQIDAGLLAQGAAAVHGAKLSSLAAELVITGAQTVSVTVKNAAMKGAGFVFAGKALRNGEVGWVSTINVSSGTGTAGMVLG